MFGSEWPIFVVEIEACTSLEGIIWMCTCSDCLDRYLSRWSDFLRQSCEQKNSLSRNNYPCRKYKIQSTKSTLFPFQRDRRDKREESMAWRLWERSTTDTGQKRPSKWTISNIVFVRSRSVPSESPLWCLHSSRYEAKIIVSTPSRSLEWRDPSSKSALRDHGRVYHRFRHSLRCYPVVKMLRIKARKMQDPSRRYPIHGPFSIYFMNNLILTEYRSLNFHSLVSLYPRSIASECSARSAISQFIPLNISRDSIYKDKNNYKNAKNWQQRDRLMII